MKNALLLPVVYTTLFSMSVVLPEYSNYVFALIVLVNALTLIMFPNKDIWAVFSSMLIGSELLALVNIFICILFYAINNPVFLPRVKRSSFIICYLIFVTSLLFAIYNSAIWNFVFSVLYLIILALTYKVIRLKTTVGNVILVIKFFIVLEFICTVIIALRIRMVKPGDLFGGTIYNSNYFANWLILTLFLFVLLNMNFLKKSFLKTVEKNFLYFSMIFIMLYLCSAKSLYIALLLTLVLYFAFKYLFIVQKNELFWFLVLLYVGFAVILKILYLEPVEIFLSEKSRFLNIYIYEPGWNYKFEYFRGVFHNELKGIRILFGYGLGQFGSRFANAFAYETMWRNDNFINNFISSNFSPKCLPQYAQYVSFYTKQFIDGIMWRSAIISYPFSSFITLVAETGVIGVSLVSYWLNKTFNNSKCKILLYYFLIACIFDIFFDNYQCILPVLLYVSVYTGLENNFNAFNSCERSV